MDDQDGRETAGRSTLLFAGKPEESSDYRSTGYSFNENEVLLLSEAGKILLKGEQLHVRNLNLEKGEAEVEGRVDSLSYLTKNAHKKDESILKRMFR